MNIRRNQSRLFHKRRRGLGRLSSFVLLGLVLGIFAFAWDRLEQWFNINTNETNSSVVRAEQAFSSGDLNTTISILRQFLETDPDNVDAIVLLARALVYRSYTDYYRTIDRKSALDLTTNALRRTPGEVDLLAIHAYVLQANDFSDRAYQTALSVVGNSPEHILGRVALSMAYGGRGIFSAALREAEKSQKLEASNHSNMTVDLFRALALANHDLGNLDEAIHFTNEALKTNNSLIPLYFEQALYAQLMSDWDSATVAYFRVLAIDPENVKARYRLCELASLLRETESALEHCTEVTERAPAWADGWYQLGREHFLSGDFAAAQSAFSRCASLQVMQNVPIAERTFECWYLQGQAAEILGDCESLVSIYGEFQKMTESGEVEQTWIYPPEGPPNCVGMPEYSTYH